MTKSQPTEKINNVLVDSIDFSGNKITSVLAKHNEFAIYEIDHPEINTRIKIFIDGHSDESEAKLQEKFNKVKQKYIEAKGLLVRASNYAMMKHRVAHTLASCLSSTDPQHNGNHEFDSLIKTITKEHEKIVINRLSYLAPSMFAVVLFFCICLWLASRAGGMPRNIISPVAWPVFSSLLAASLGGGLSLLISAKSLNFEEFTVGRNYALLGVERLLLACMAGAVAYIATKSEIAFSTFTKNNPWAFMAIIVLSGFSESLIPGILGKLNSKET